MTSIGSPAAMCPSLPSWLGWESSPHCSWIHVCPSPYGEVKLNMDRAAAHPPRHPPRHHLTRYLSVYDSFLTVTPFTSVALHHVWKVSGSGDHAPGRLGRLS